MTDMLARAVPAAGERERSFFEEFDRLYALAVGAARARGFVDVDARRVGVETMARAYAAWNRIGGEQYVEAWVQKSAHRVCVDVLRRGGTTRDARSDVERVLRSLPRREREAAELCVLADVSEAQAAAALGRSVEQVQAAVEAARERLDGVDLGVVDGGGVSDRCRGRGQGRSRRAWPHDQERTGCAAIGRGGRARVGAGAHGVGGLRA